MKDIGEYLKFTREDMGISIEEASKDLSINISNLKNIEDGNFEYFNNVFKLKEYILKYAKYLNVNQKEIEDDFDLFIYKTISKLDSNMIDITPKKVEIYSPYTKDLYEDKSYKFKIVIIVLLIIMMLLILFILNLD